MLQYGLQERPPLMAWRLLIEHARLDHLLIHIQFVLGSCQDLFLHTVHGAESQYPDLVLLADAVRSVLCLQILWERTVCSEGPCAWSSRANKSPGQEENMGGLLNPPSVMSDFAYVFNDISYLLWKNSRSFLVEGTWVQISQADWNTPQVLKSRSWDVFICP